MLQLFGLSAGFLAVCFIVGGALGLLLALLQATYHTALGTVQLSVFFGRGLVRVIAYLSRWSMANWMSICLFISSISCLVCMFYDSTLGVGISFFFSGYHLLIC